MRRATDVDTNIDIGQGLHVGSVVKEKGLVLDREVEIEGDEGEFAPKFLNFIFLLYYLNFFYFLLLFRSEEHTSELQSRSDLVCRLLLEKKKIKMCYCL